MALDGHVFSGRGRRRDGFVKGELGDVLSCLPVLVKLPARPLHEQGVASLDRP